MCFWHNLSQGSIHALLNSKNLNSHHSGFELCPFANV